uniref:ATPase family AAA domain containing 5a n=1 Tax=Oncorhynchus mykiss TaxID=8022 RepID=A0A8K9XP26_ONCMY
MDYFSRKTTPVREKGSTPEQTKENRLGPQPSESPASLDSPVRLPVKPRQKQGRKPSKVKSRVDPEPEDTLDVPKAKELCPLQISPRTLTIQAEVHTISPSHEPVLVAEKKIASIFSREKEGSLAPVVVKTASFPHPQSRLELLPAPKRRSNVVLQEEDLELSVVESESSTPKCSQTERKQFMSAFKQPAKPGKGPGKQPVDKALGEAVEEENHSAAPTEEQPGKNAAKKKPQRRGRKKALEQESVPSPAAQEDHVPMETDAVETDSKPKGESNTEAKPGAEPTPSTPTTVRRSTREAPCRQTPVVDPVTPVRKTKKERVKDVAAVTVDCPVQMSTPKSDKSRHRLFRAQMMSLSIVFNCLACASWSLYYLQSTVEPGCWELLTTSKRRGMDLLYSNMEALLPLPTTHLTVTTHRRPQEVQQVAEGSETDGSPVKVSSRMKKKKKHNKFELESVKVREEEVKEKAPPPVRMRVPLTAEQRMKSEPVSHCLGSLAEFLDHMSLLDSSLCLHTSPVGGARYTHRTFGLRVEIKDGMNDESGEECHGGSWVEGERAGEIQAAVEALSFQRCRAGVEEAWGTAQGLEGELGKEAVNELTLPVAPHRRGFRLTQDSPCEPKVLQKRREVMDILPRQVAGTLGNRPAAALDFLPFLRTICRSETLKEQFKVKRRFLHYLDAIHLGLPKNTLQYLAEDFP